ncbi:unnamed protein product [Mytilus edulis]|uniref:Uncharacterized protein n=1 Tax=Mytilus edulis TaxID=6550 RepID=A0A8S3SB82_MYTED|nr:unnamed protein product [Mytilus edulis]
MASSTKRRTISKKSSSKIAWTIENTRNTDDILYTMYWYITAMSWLDISTLKDDLETFNSFLYKQTKDNCGKIGKDLTKLRIVHLELCKTISILDSCFSWLLFTWFVLNIANGCFIAFVLLNESYDKFGTAMLVFWLISSCVYIGVSSVSASILHEKAHAPLEYLYDIDVNDIKPEDQPQLYLFLSKLTSSSVGLTAFGLVTITKELLLTLACI